MTKLILSCCILPNLCIDFGELNLVDDDDTDSSDASVTIEQDGNGHSAYSFNAREPALRRLEELKKAAMLAAMKLQWMKQLVLLKHNNSCDIVPHSDVVLKCCLSKVRLVGTASIYRESTTQHN